MKIRFEIFIILGVLLFVGMVNSNIWVAIGANSFVDDFNRGNTTGAGQNWTNPTGQVYVRDNVLYFNQTSTVHANSTATNVNFTHDEFGMSIKIEQDIDDSVGHQLLITDEQTFRIHIISINGTNIFLSGVALTGSNIFNSATNTFYNLTLKFNWTRNTTEWFVNDTGIGNITYEFNGSGSAGNTRFGEVRFGSVDTNTNVSIDYIQWGNGNSTNPINIILNEPVANLSTINSTLTFDCSVSSGLNLNNLSLFIDGVRNISNTTAGTSISLITEVTQIPVGSHNWTCEAFDINENSDSLDNRTFVIAEGFAENSQTFNTTSFETATETFSIDITFNSTLFTTIAGVLNYDGTNFLGSRSGIGDSAIFTTAVSIPSVTAPENRTFNWIINLTNTTGVNVFNSTSNNQSVDNIVLDLCNSTLSQNYINFTFRNETINQENINATIVSTWTYFLGNGNVNSSLSFSNSSENPSYAFCFTPVDRPVNTILELAYNNAESQQRIFSSTSLLSNVTTNQILYLLPTISGLFGQFRTESTTGNILAGVKGTITRVLGASTITVTSDFTDSSGLVVYFLNPDITYTGTFTLSGFSDNVFTFVPVTDLRVVIMGGVVGTGVNGTEISKNTSYQITPTNNSLNNNTDFLFGFNVTSAETITLISMNITNTSGSQLGFQSNAGQGFISETINTGNNTIITGLYVIQTASETITLSKTWIIGDEFVGDYSIFRQLSLYFDYGFTDFWRLLIVIAVITLVLIFLSAGEVTDTSESKIITGLILIWIFSIVGWLDNPIVVAQTGIAQFSKQYGIAILSTAAGSFFILRRVFIRRI